MKRRNGLLFLTAGLMFGVGIGIIVLFWAPNSAAMSRVPPGVGLEAPDFNIFTLKGENFKLSSFRGQSVVLNFWATWCPPCKEEMPLFNTYSGRLADKIVFLAIDAEEDSAVVKTYVDENGITLRVGMDQEGKVADLYFVNSFPVTIFIDPDGIVRAQHIGQLDEKLLVKYLATIGLKQ